MAPSFTIRSQVFSAPALPPALYLVSTPIGNLGDITIRALETLAACDVIACEDTRTSGVLLSRYGIDRPKISYTEHNADARGAELLRRIESGESVALISDAGTPLVSDPGFRLVREAAEHGITVVPIPGANAPVTGLVGSGLSAASFCFAGFLPPKSKARQKAFEQCLNTSTTTLFFEAPTRIASALKDAVATLGEDRPACVARELTKMHETFHRGTLAELADEFAAMERVRGEIVLIIEGAEAQEASGADIDELLIEALATMKTKDAANHVAAQTGQSKQEIYRRALALKGGGDA
ncbi:16S rRNA (cytidine(1402)-2'-O)-methyltransferase [Pseudahrensia aquimaris]|uniref:Ribosomal RNA small subunit methyltransferase I n=1 Tax=Pseudahrensia aquimaris TaxID=744461 RepID=A0ABW3FHI5_9HYPH